LHERGSGEKAGRSGRNPGYAEQQRFTSTGRHVRFAPVR